MQVSEAIDYLYGVSSFLKREVSKKNSVTEFWFSLNLKEEGWDMEHGVKTFPERSESSCKAKQAVEDLIKSLEKDFEELKDGFTCDCCERHFDVFVTGFTILFYFDHEGNPVTKTSHNIYALGETFA
jgi:hypothetical protein